MVRNRYQIQNPKHAAFFGAVCWLTYFSIYLGRLNFSASMTEMLQTGVWGKAELGGVAAAFYLAYGLGQLPSGILGDYASGRFLVMSGLAGAGLMNLIFPFVGSIMGMKAVWFVNGLVQAMVWPPMARLITDLTSGKRSVRIMLLMSFTSPAGMLCAYLLSAVLMKIGSWKYCFFGAGIWLLGIAVFWFTAIAWLWKETEKTGIEKAEKREEKQKNSGISWASYAASGVLWMIAATFIHGVLKDGLTTWIPTYLTEKFAITPSFSVLLTMVLPVINLSGVPLAEAGNKSVFRNEAKTAAAAFGFTFLSIIGMIWAGGNSLYGTVGLFAVVTSMMTAVNTLFISLLPMHFQNEGRVATMSGMLNAVTYLGSALASVLFGYAAEIAGWKGTQLMWCLCAVTGVLFCLAAAKKWNHARKNIYEESGR